MICVYMDYTYFFKKKIYFYKTNLQNKSTKKIIHTIPNTLYKRKEIKAKEKLEILKEGRKRAFYFIVLDVDKQQF